MPEVFICHATEDKELVAARLARMLSEAGVTVWYDDYSLKLGDSLRRAIDSGLAQSHFGVVILSPSFFSKAWPQAELDGLFAKEIGAQKVILPVWHLVGRADVLKHSPILADRYAALTSDGLDKVVVKILDVVRPGTSHLTASGHTLDVTPSYIRLHSGEWAVKTPLTISNPTDNPAFSVQVKLALDPLTLDPGSIHVDLGFPTTRIQEPVSGVSVTPDGILLYLQEASGRNALSIVLHTIAPRQTREIQVAGTIAIKSSADVSLWDFKASPPEVLRKGGAVAFPFTVPENVQLRGMGMLIKRRP